ncbi:MEKHLA domain-containing protein [Tardiphaga sp. 709]|uniref:MEKHLA domain-containing protein n=1 Tax=Tardiphaga sp. 709 TaxID=3076039 RepID=UPI0028F13F4B|nr:MEKHLA domain-containing protein [Tardiphaga sp. 709]WNV10316.1 MEKHLA domain-containing protein [Tardiphaga sp. 709]
MTPATPPAFALDTSFFKLLSGSYLRTVGKPLLAPVQDAAWLYSDAPFAVLAHSTAADPVFVYANKTAQRCFEYGWDEFITIPSRLSAEGPNRDERQRLLDAVAHNGFIDNYRGLRIAKSGRRFWIEGGIVWELRDENGERRGQAALFTSWTDV